MAKRIRTVHRGVQTLYRLGDGRYALVSHSSKVKETAAFLADENGKVLDWRTPLVCLGGRVRHSKVLAHLEG